MDRKKDDLSEISLLPWINNNHSAQSLKKYISLAKFKIFKKGEILSKQGEVCNEIMYLSKGTVKVSLINSNGMEKIFWYNISDSLICEVPFFHEYESNASIVAVTDCCVYRFSREIFREILKGHPDIYIDMGKNMAEKIRILCHQIAEISFSKPEKQICRFLYYFAKKYGKKNSEFINITLNISHEEIASINSLHRVTVTKVLTILKKENILNRDKNGNIIIYDMENLKKYASD